MIDKELLLEYFTGRPDISNSKEELERLRNNWQNSCQFLQMMESFSIQLKANQSAYSCLEYDQYQDKVKHIVAILVLLFPDQISIQITNDISIFFILKFKDISVFVEHFLLVEAPDDEDEVFVTIRKNGGHIFGYIGSFHDATGALLKWFINRNTS